MVGYNTIKGLDGRTLVVGSLKNMDKLTRCPDKKKCQDENYECVGIGNCAVYEYHRMEGRN